jgi:hypothetical protein
MTNDLVNQQLPLDDGWADAANEAAERFIRGKILKFSDWRWTAGKEAEPLEHGTRLVALGTVAMWVRWEDGKPVEYRTRQPGQRMPERDELGYDDESAWALGLNDEPQDPWRNTRLVHLVDPQTAEAFTFSTSSWGGRGAVADLGDQIARMRKVHPDAIPLVELRAAEMLTRFGRKSKPVFKVVAWQTASGGNEPVPVERQIPAKEAEQTAARSELDDAIPF